jgi:hypothetical protein
LELDWHRYTGLADTFMARFATIRTILREQTDPPINDNPKPYDRKQNPR